MRKLISYQLQRCYLLLLRSQCDVLHCGKRSSLFDTSFLKNILLNHLQATLLKTGYCNQYNTFSPLFFDCKPQHLLLCLPEALAQNSMNCDL